MRYFYWNNGYRNAKDENLIMCLQKYGTRTIFTREIDLFYRIIYLDDNKIPESSFLLWARRLSDKENIPVHFYEKSPDIEKRIIRGWFRPVFQMREKKWNETRNNCPKRDTPLYKLSDSDNSLKGVFQVLSEQVTRAVGQDFVKNAEKVFRIKNWKSEY